MALRRGIRTRAGEHWTRVSRDVASSYTHGEVMHALSSCFVLFIPILERGRSFGPSALPCFCLMYEAQYSNVGRLDREQSTLPMDCVWVVRGNIHRASSERTATTVRCAYSGMSKQQIATRVGGCGDSRKTAAKRPSRLSSDDVHTSVELLELPGQRTRSLHFAG